MPHHVHVLIRQAIMLKSMDILFLITFTVSSATFPGNPDNYLVERDKLKAGDTLLLEPGNYLEGLSITNMHGEQNKWIVITGQVQHEAVLVARDWNNTMNIKEASYIKIIGFSFEGLDYPAIDAIKAQGDSTEYAHHIWIENNVIKNHGGSQQTVGISTKIAGWDWTIRYNKIIEAGTGLYLGNSEGDMPFIRGLIEFNLVVNPIGYCMQIKQQNNRPAIADIPMEDVTTVIRHNVFTKDDRSSPDGDRPNLLVSGTFEEGPGSGDRYEIYGNFLYYNPRENLFQGSGNISLHNNILAICDVRAVNFQEHHERKPKELFVYCNTIYDTNKGILLSGADTNYDQIFRGNAVYTAEPISGITGFDTDNRTGTVAEAASVFATPTQTLAQMDFYPLPGALDADVTFSDFSIKDDAWNRDFNGNEQGGAYYGAYSREGANPGWQLALDIKELGVVDVKEKKLNAIIENNIQACYTGPEIIKVEYTLVNNSLCVIRIYSLEGRHIRESEKAYRIKGKHIEAISTYGMSKGIYILVLHVDENVRRRKIVLTGG